MLNSDVGISRIVVLNKRERAPRSSGPRGSNDAEPDSNTPMLTWRWRDVRDLNDRTRANPNCETVEKMYPFQFQVMEFLGLRYCPRDARPNRCTPDLRRPCEADAETQGRYLCGCPPCAHQFSCDSVRFDRPTLSRSKQDVRVDCCDPCVGNLDDEFKLKL